MTQSESVPGGDPQAVRTFGGRRRTRFVEWASRPILAALVGGQGELALNPALRADVTRGLARFAVDAAHALWDHFTVESPAELADLDEEWVGDTAVPVLAAVLGRQPEMSGQVGSSRRAVLQNAARTAVQSAAALARVLVAPDQQLAR